jgi:hypothetical protein
LRDLPSESVHCVVTSPPYYGLRCYGVDGQIGLEPTPEQHIAALVEVFREVRRVLRADGCMFLNYGDAYASGPAGNKMPSGFQQKSQAAANGALAQFGGGRKTEFGSAKPKDLLMMPSRVALALQADGWWLRSMMPWIKRSAMPESVTDRPATAIEYVFLLTKSGDTTFWQHRDGGGTRTRPKPDYRWINQLTGAERLEPRDGKEWKRVNLWRGRDYFWDGEAVRQEGTGRNWLAEGGNLVGAGVHKHKDGIRDNGEGRQGVATGRNFRNSDLFYASLEPPHGLISGDGPLALDVNPMGLGIQHFASYPPKLIEPLIKAGTSEKGCCPECGAPWVREVERTSVTPRDYEGKWVDADPQSAGRRILANVRARREAGGDHNNPFPRPKTTGWSPSCACPPSVYQSDLGPQFNCSPIATPCTVLDPFLGAGTTALVADRLGRNCIGIELNPEYVEMTEQRIKDDAGMFAEVS